MILLRRLQSYYPAAKKSLCREITTPEIKLALQQIGEDHASGIDGYTTCFYKNAQRIIGKEIIEAVFTKGEMHYHYNCP